MTQNVLEVQRGKGTFVVDKQEGIIEFGFDSLNLVHLKIKDLYEMRMMLEPQMAYYATMRATDEEIEEIIDLGEKIEAVSSYTTEDSQGNQMFHNAIAKATHNAVGIQMMEIINESLVKLFRENELHQTLYGDVLLDHKMIMDYIRMRDAEGAKQAMYLHIKHAIKDYDI